MVWRGVVGGWVVCWVRAVVCGVLRCGVARVVGACLFSAHTFLFAARYRSLYGSLYGSVFVPVFDGVVFCGSSLSASFRLSHASLTY